MKNVAKCYKDFFGYFNALKTHCDYTVVWTVIDSMAKNFVFFSLQPLTIKSKTSAYMEHLLQNVVDFALITKAFM